ncbi:MAG: hypothetical protein ABR586_04195, partial [Thermoplasmatota archaeon]
MREGVKRRWEPYPDARAFLADRLPQVWDQVRVCRLGTFHTSEKTDDPDRVKVWSRRCGMDPWCLECVHYQHWRRVQRTFERWAKCTPQGEQPRFSHIVITAPIYDAPESWGLKASRNPKAFMDVVWRVLTEIYGEGLGAHMSYQDHGEAGLARRHPHIDLTLNGWTVKDARVDELPYYELGGGGYDHFIDTIEKHANALHLGARASSLYVGAIIEGFERYHKILGYQVRELLDLRKLRYDRTGSRVGWESYKEPYDTTWMPVRDWFLAFEEYCARLRVFNGESGRKLHYDYGHMAANHIRATQAATGGKPDPHPEDCPCSRCGDWRRVFLQGGQPQDWHAL